MVNHDLSIIDVYVFFGICQGAKQKLDTITSKLEDGFPDVMNQCGLGSMPFAESGFGSTRYQFFIIAETYSQLVHLVYPFWKVLIYVKLWSWIVGPFFGGHIILKWSVGMIYRSKMKSDFRMIQIFSFYMISIYVWSKINPLAVGPRIWIFKVCFADWICSMPRSKVDVFFLVPALASIS